MFAIIKSLFQRKIRNNDGSDQPAVMVPLGLSPGSIWTPPDLDLDLAVAQGSILKPPIGDQSIKSVGKLSLFGLDVYHLRFDGNESFLQAVTNPNMISPIKQFRLFTHHDTIIPSTVADWEFWLGHILRNERGEIVRDQNGRIIPSEPGLIGNPSFQIDGPPEIVYHRQWPSETNSAVKFDEHFKEGHTTVDVLTHEGMEYSRYLADGATLEYLYAVAHGNRGSVKIYIGIDLDPKNQRIISLG